MGDIVTFRKRKTCAASEPHLSGAPAQILFFVGVRYERMDEAGARPAGAPNSRGDESGSGKKRKRRARA